MGELLGRRRRRRRQCLGEIGVPCVYRVYVLVLYSPSTMAVFCIYLNYFCPYFCTEYALYLLLRVFLYILCILYVLCSHYGPLGSPRSPQVSWVPPPPRALP